MFSLCAFAQQQHPTQTSICAVSAHPSRFHNKIIRVRAAAFGGMEAQILMDIQDGKPNSSCEEVWLEFDSAKSDATTQKFWHLFAERLPESPPCNLDRDTLQSFQHALDPSVPAPKPCSMPFCISCPRYNIVATFTGKLRDSEREPGNAGFGHLNQFRLQLEVRTVRDLDIKDTLPAAGLK